MTADRRSAAADLEEEVRGEVRRELAADRERTSGRLGHAFVEARDVWLAMGGREILRGVSFQVERGETLCILGGSGAGKTTILRLILALIQPGDGRILIDGQNIAEASDDEVAGLRQRMGMVFQGSALFDSLTVFENVAFPLRVRGRLEEEDISRRVREVLTFVDLDPDAVVELLPAELSGGMRKRVGIARAIVHRPEILLFDEPTSGLDPVTTKTIDELILKLRREMSVCGVVVTHDIKSAARISTQAALLAAGRITFMGTPEEMFAAEDPYVRAFLG